jgi:hypothetical protein
MRYLPLEIAKSYWGLDKPQDAAKALSVSITTSSGGSIAALSVVAVKNNLITIDVSNFNFPDAQLDVALNPAYVSTSAGPAANQNSSSASANESSATPSSNHTAKAAVSSTSVITCVKGKIVKKVSGVKPVCPKGFAKK